MDEILSPEGAIKKEWLEIYNTQYNVLWNQLVTFNTNIFTLERIEQFPFWVFLPLYDDRIFWQTTRRALVETSILIAWRIIWDTDSRSKNNIEEVLTLRKFKNNIRRNLRNNKARQNLDARLIQVDFEQRIADLEKKVRNARHNFIAHLNSSRHLNPNQTEISELAISLDELKSLCNTTCDLLDALSFGNHHSLWLWAYGEDKRNKSQTDIDLLLDLVARNSIVLKMPEEQPDLLKFGIYKYKETELKIVNEYRVKFNLPKIDQTQYE